MKRILIILFVLILTGTIETVDARRGCCSHHGGICGCQCCDGTPLSAKCAPYYDCDESESGYSPATHEDAVLENTQSDSLSNLNDSVYFNVKSYKYHCPTCRWAKKCTQNCITLILKSALELNGTPCKVCGGSCK